MRHVARAEEDGFASPLVAGLRASADADRLADEMAFSMARLTLLEADPPEVYAAAAADPDVEEGLDALVRLALEGPRGVADPQRTVAAFDAWAQRAGSRLAALRGDEGWTPERRFDRVFERLGSLPGFARAARFELLVSGGRLGLIAVRATSLHLADRDRDDASLAAKRVFGIGDRMNLERRALALADACEVPIEALDLALANFGQAPEAGRITHGAPADVADEPARERVLAALGR